MIEEKGTNKYFNSKFVFITSINSISKVWSLLPENAKNKHQFWELGRRVSQQIESDIPDQKGKKDMYIYIYINTKFIFNFF